MKTIKIIVLATLSCLFFSCEKDFLDKKPDKSLLIPNTIEDLQALLDNHDGVMNVSPALGEIASDNFSTTAEGLEGLFTQLEKSVYLWNMDASQITNIPDWDEAYKQVFYSNIVLDGVDDLKMKNASPAALASMEGAALFYRSLAFYNLSQQFAIPYDKATAASSPGVPIRLTADVNDKQGRGTLAETYSRIINDLEAAIPLLPVQVLYKTRPSKAAALAVLARVYLTMGEYENALKKANAALQLNSSLVDYNTLSLSAERPFPIALPSNNDEVIFYSRFSYFSFHSSALVNADSMLYKSYQEDDLRKKLFFVQGPEGIIDFKGNYSGTSAVFGGIATDELYLIKAECLARTQRDTEAMNTLNTLLEKRWKSGNFVPFTANDPEEALIVILSERRKQLVNRGLRWSDLRRLNKESRFAVSIRRIIDGQNFNLQANDKRYTLLIPANEIANSGIQQNDR